MSIPIMELSIGGKLGEMVSQTSSLPPYYLTLQLKKFLLPDQVMAH